MRTLLGTAILLLLFCNAAGQTKYSKRELLQDLSVLEGIITRTNPQLTRAGKAEMEKVFAEAARSFSLDNVTGLDFMKYISALRLNTGYDAHASFTLQEHLFPDLPVFFPVPVYILEDRFVVNSEGAALPYASIIKTINGVSTNSILQKLVPADREKGFMKYRVGSVFHAVYFLIYGAANDFVITYQEDINASEEKTVTCKAVSLRDAFALQQGAVFPLSKLTVPNANPVTWVFDEVTRTFYLPLRSFMLPPRDSSMLSGPVFDSLFKVIRDKGARSLVLDIRGNGGGAMELPGLLLSYLMDSTFYEAHHFKMVPVKNIPVDYLKRIDQIAVPSKTDGRKMLYRLYDGSVTRNGEVSKNMYFKRDPSPYHFSGQVGLLTDGGTFSAAAYFASLFQHFKRGTIMGSPTGGAARQMTAGHTLEYELPHTKIAVSLPLMYMTFDESVVDDSQSDYIMPDIRISFEQQYQYFYRKQDWGIGIRINAP